MWRRFAHLLLRRGTAVLRERLRLFAGRRRGRSSAVPAHVARTGAGIGTAMLPAVAGSGRRVRSAAYAGRCAGTAAAHLAAAVKRSLRPANRRTGGRTPAGKGDTRPDGDRRRGVALGPPTI